MTAVERALPHRASAQSSARRAHELPPDALRRRLDPRSLTFASTEEVEPLAGTIGQPRALAALELGLEVATPGFNVFVAGEPGSGRFTTALDHLRRVAAAHPRPDDWVYVHDFAVPDRPRALRLPAGRGTAFATDMREFVLAARREIARAFESEDYARRQHELVSSIAERRAAFVEELVAYAHERGYVIDVTAAGVVTAPLVDGEQITREQFEALPAARRAEIERHGSEITERTAVYVRRVHELEQEAAARLRELEREVALFAAGPLLRDLRERYTDLPAVLAHVEDVEADVVAHIDDFRRPEEGAGPLVLPLLGAAATDFFRYAVNVVVDNSALEGAPVVVEPNPTYYNLAGRVEYRASLGTMTTDFREIRPGALHRANGGFLLLEVADVFRHPYAWEALKRALRTGEIRIENLGEEFSGFPTASLRPEPIPLSVKVVLVGTALVYRLLHLLDDDVQDLFKVKAEFAPEMPWDDEAPLHYAAFASRSVRERGLRHLDREAVARLVDLGARLRDDQRKVSTRLMEIADVIAEASHWAGTAGRDLVSAADVDRAVAQREYRSGLVEDRVREWIADGTIVIDTEGARLGQVNGISVVDLGDHAFGRPTRITARVAPGIGGPKSIEREIELSGPIHAKGFLVVSGYLAGTYGAADPLALDATLTFEQSYDEVEGDSASSSELYALLSALAGVPISQELAVTGSVDQHGVVQAVGSVTRKVEGFFATCKARGLTGGQGVLVPAANVHNLMLADEIVDAVREGRFHVWAVRTVDEGIELLTGLPAGVADAQGRYPEGSVHGLVQARLEAFAERVRELGTPPEGHP